MCNKYFYSILLLFVFLFSHSQEIAREEKINDSVNVLLNLARQSLSSAKEGEIFDLVFKAVNYSNVIKEDYTSAEAYSFLANLYQRSGEEENAIKNFNIAIDYAKNSDNYSVISSCYIGLGNYSADVLKDNLKAVEYYNQSATYALKTKSYKNVFVSYLNMGWILLDDNILSEAIVYLEKAKQSLDKVEAKIPLYTIYIEHQLGRYYVKKRNYKKATFHLNKAIKIAKKDDYYSDLIELHNEKFNLHEAFNESILAIESLKAVQKYKDLNYDVQRNEQIENAKAEFQVNEAKRELEIAKEISESNKKIITISIIGILFLIGAIIALIYGFRKNKSNYILQTNNQLLIKAKDNAERLTKLKSEFISRISHELRTPLYGVVGITSMLQEDKEVTSKHGALIDSLQFSGDHLINLVNNVLKISKIESHDIKLVNTNTNIEVLVNNIFNSFKFQAKEKGLVLKLELGKEISHYNYLVDAVKLSEILINLLDNAIKFTDRGEVTLQVSIENIAEDKDALFFNIKDTGKGLLEKNQELIFENFKQTNEEENTNDGAGLGLTIVKHLLKIMGSDIQVKSTINKGSTFYFALHLTKGNVNNLHKNNKHNSERKKKVLIVEDNKTSQMVTSNLVKLIGHDFTVAENGLEAIEKVKNDFYDVILMDLNMPVMNGYESTKQIKKLYPDLNIIALTANEVSEVYNKCLFVGMDEVINKPLSKNELDQVLIRYID